MKKHYLNICRFTVHPGSHYMMTFNCNVGLCLQSFESARGLFRDFLERLSGYTCCTPLIWLVHWLIQWESIPMQHTQKKKVKKTHGKYECVLSTQKDSQQYHRISKYHLVICVLGNKYSLFHAHFLCIWKLKVYTVQEYCFTVAILLKYHKRNHF